MNIIGRYVIGQFMRVFLLSIAAATGLFLVIDFFERIGGFVRYNPPTSAVAAFFLLEIPQVIAEIYPAVALIAVLIALGLLARHREILALGACGVSAWQLAAPLLLASFLLSIGVLVWNETVVPPTASRARTIKDIVIKKKRYRGLLNASSLWFQSAQGFFNIDYFDANRNALFGLTFYETDPSFRLNRIIEIPEALWRNGRWEFQGGKVKNLGPEGEIVERDLEPGEFELTDTPEDFLQMRRHASEFSFGQLKRQIDVVRAKGLDPGQLLVDLYLKLAMPFSGLVSVLVGFPLAIRGGRRGGLAYTLGLGMVVGFAYWVTMAVAVSAGHAGTLPPFLAAWSANILFAILGGSLFLGSEM